MIKKSIKLLALALIMVVITACGKVELKDGEKAIVTFNEGAISSNDLYEALKKTYGAEKLVDLIDSYLLNKKYETDSDEKDYVSQSVKTTKETAKSYNVDFETYISYYYGIDSEKAFKEYISLNYKRNLWIEEYGQEVVTDRQIDEYYETEIVGDMTLSQILITPMANDDMTEEEKNKAEENALNKAKDIIKELNNGKDFSVAAKEYSEDEATSSNGGSLGKVNSEDLPTEVFEAAKNLKVGAYTLTAVKSSQGYYIIYKSAQDEKPKLDEELVLKIKALIGKEISSEASFSHTALNALREKNGMKFEDTNLESSYQKFLERNSNYVQ